MVEFSKHGKLVLAFFQKCSIDEQLMLLKQIETIALPKRYLLNIETFQNAISEYIEYYTDNPIVEFAWNNREKIPDEFKILVEKIPPELVELFRKIKENEKIKKKLGITKLVKKERRKRRKEKKLYENKTT